MFQNIFKNCLKKELKGNLSNVLRYFEKIVSKRYLSNVLRYFKNVSKKECGCQCRHVRAGHCRGKLNQVIFLKTKSGDSPEN